MRDFGFSIRLPGVEPISFSGIAAVLALVGVSLLTILVLKFICGVLISFHTILLLGIIAFVVYGAHKAGGLGAFLDRFRR